MEQGALTAVDKEERVVAESELKKAQERIRRLERILGQKTEEVEILKEAVRIGREKKTDLAKTLGRSRRFRITAICRALDVSRSHLTESLKKQRFQCPDKCKSLTIQGYCR